MRHHQHQGPPWAQSFDGPPRFGGPRARRGGVRRALIAALVDGPGHGYDLIGRLDERSGGRWRPSPGSVYPTLQLLEDEGLVTSDEVEGKRVYTLTDAGTEAAQEAPGRPGWLIDHESGPSSSIREAVGKLAGAAIQVSQTGTPEQIAEAEGIITDARRRIYGLLADA